MRFQGFRQISIACAVIALVVDLCSTAIAPLLPTLDHELGLGHALAGLLVAFYGIGYMIGAYPALRFTSWFGLVPTTMIGTGLAIVGSLTFAFSSNFEVLCAGRVLGGFGSVVVYTGILSIASTTAGTERRGSAIGMVYSGTYAGSAIGPLLGSAADAFGRTIIFGLLSLVQLVIVGFVTRLPKLPPDPIASLRTTFGYLRFRRALIALWITGIPPFGLGVLVVSGSYRIIETGGSALLIAIAFSGMAVLYVFSSPTLGRISDVRGRRQPIIFLMLLATLPLLLLTLADVPIPSVALIAIGGTLFTLVGGPSFALLSDSVQERGGTAAESTFLMSLYWGPSSALGAILAGIFHGVVGAELSFLFLAGTTVASAGLVARYIR